MKYFILLLTINLCIAQENLQAGFDLLDQGHFEEAKEFFEPYYFKSPDNPTILICYGRSLGLSGSPEEAYELFDKARLKFSDNFEVLLNFAEACLWNKKFEEAISEYHLLENAAIPQFVIKLNLANAYSGLKKHDSAIYYVNQALSLDKENISAQNSQKFILMAGIDQAFNQSNWEKADSLLAVLKSNSKAKLEWNRLSSIYYLNRKDYHMAHQSALKLLELQQEPNWSDIGLVAYIMRIMGKPRKGLQLVLSFPTPDEYNYQYQEALIYSYVGIRNFNKAKEHMDIVENQEPNSTKFLLLKTRLCVSEKNYKFANVLVGQLLEENQNSMDILLTSADIFKAQNKFKRSFNRWLQAKKLNDLSPQLATFRSGLNRVFENSFMLDNFYSKDSGNNLGRGFEIKAIQWFKPWWNIQIKWMDKRMNVQGVDDFNQTNNTMFKTNLRVLPTLQLGVGFNAARLKFNETKMQFFKPNLSLNYNYNNTVIFNLEFQNKFQDFTYDLIKRGLSYGEFKSDFMVSLKNGFGTYLNFVNQQYSDDNSGNILFGSLFYDLRNKPLVKVGINASYMSFKENRSQEYFSPSKFYSVEPFLQFMMNDVDQKFYSNFLIGTGLQQIENEKSQFAYRLEASASYLLYKHFKIGAYYKRTNTASTTITGFVFNQFGIKLNYIFYPSKDRFYQ